MLKKTTLTLLVIFAFCTSIVLAQSTRKSSTGATPAKPKTAPAPSKSTTTAKDSTAKSAKAASAAPSPVDDKPLRVEKEAKSAGEGAVLTPAGSSGVILTYRSSEKSAKGNKFKDWVFTKYDNQFNEQYNKVFTFE